MIQNQITDQLNRPIRDLRISVTDRCNFRCTYCMPKEVFGDNYVFLPQDEQLSFSEIVRLAKLFSRLGVKKIRLTGGEPLLRRNIDELVYELRQITGIKDIGLTTNGVLLKKYGRKLFDAGIRRLNISLDAQSPEIFGMMNGRGMDPQLILNNIDYVQKLGFNIKVNMVVKKDINDSEILPMATYFKKRNITLRFIEFMDVGNDNNWSFDKVVTKKEIMDIVNSQYPLEPVEPAYFGEVAKQYRYIDNQAEVGFITSVSESFCSSCTRARLSSDGQFFTCLFAAKGYDLKKLLRNGATDENILAVITDVWENRSDRYSDERTEATALLKKMNMSYMGG